MADCFALDKSGLLFAPAGGVTNSPSLVRFYSTISADNLTGQYYAPPDKFTSLLRLADNLKKLDFSVVAFRDRPDGSVEAVLSGGQRIVFTRDDDLEAVLANFKTVTSDVGFGGNAGFAKVDYIDLRFGNKVFYKLK